MLGELEGGLKRTVEAGDEAVTLFEEFRGEESGRFFLGEESSGDVFGDTESAIGLTTFVGGISLLDLGGVAVRAGTLEIGKWLGDDLLVVATCFLNDALGELFDLVHEGVTSEFSFLHLVKFGLPVAGHFGAGERFDVHFLEEVNEADSFAGGDKFAAVTGDVFLANEPFNGGGAGGGGAKSTLGHRFAEGIVIDKFSGSFHGGEEGGFSVAGRRVGLLFDHLDVDGLGVFAVLHNAELVFASSDTGLAPVDGEPAGDDQDLAVGAEGVLLSPVINGGESLGDLELGVRKEDGEEALHDHVVKFGGGLIEFDNATGGDDREVIGDLGVVKNALLELQAVVLERVLGPVGEAGTRL